MTREEWIDTWTTFIVGQSVRLAFGEGPASEKVARFVDIIKSKLGQAYNQAQPPITNGEKKHEANGNQNGSIPGAERRASAAQVPAQAQRSPPSNGRV